MSRADDASTSARDLYAALGVARDAEADEALGGDGAPWLCRLCRCGSIKASGAETDGGSLL